MKKIILILINVLLLSNIAAFAQNMSQEQIKQQINRKAADTKTLKCDFIQTKHMKMLNKKQVSKGVMAYAQPDKLRWEYLSPNKYVFIINGKSVKLKNDNRSDIIDVNKNKLFKQIAGIMMMSVVGKCLSNDKDFKTTVADKDNEWVATLTPLRKEMKSMFQLILLHFNKAKAVVTVVEMIEKNGDKTVIELKNIHINENIPANTFSVN